MNSAFVEALADAQTDGLIDLSALRLKCVTAIAGGDGTVSFVMRAGLNGKMAEQECRMDTTELLTAVNAALAQANGTAVGITYADFSDLGRP